MDLDYNAKGWFMNVIGKFYPPKKKSGCNRSECSSSFRSDVFIYLSTLHASAEGAAWTGRRPGAFKSAFKTVNTGRPKCEPAYASHAL